MGELGERLGNSERDAAVAALKIHYAQGRLDSREYEDRSLQARQVRTWPELDVLFADLPQPRPAPGTPFPVTAPGPPEANYQAAVRGGLVPEPWAGWVMALTPFATLILFLDTGFWMWWLAMPIVGLIVYGPDGKHQRGRRRRRGLN